MRGVGRLLLGAAAAALVISVAAETECTDCNCDKCKCRASKPGAGCPDPLATNTCPERQSDNHALCKYNATDTAQPNYACKFPTDMTPGPSYAGVGSSRATSTARSLLLTPRSWTFFHATVGKTTPMHHIDYALSIPAGEPNVTVAFLVGRCLQEVECGACPPRCELLQAADRRPQFCSLPDYCPGCTDDGCGSYVLSASNSSAKEYTGQWSNLKSCQEEKANFYVGVYAMPMDTVFDTDQDAVQAELTIWWNGQSAGAMTLPSLVLLLLATAMGMMH